MKTKRSSLKINAISNWASLFVQVLIGFFLTPYIISHLGKNGYGIWVLVSNFIGYYGLLNMGVGSAITRYMARSIAMNDNYGLNSVANTAITMFSTTGLIAIILSIIFSTPLTTFFQIDPSQSSNFQNIIILLGIATGLSFPSGVFSAMITAKECYLTVNIVNIFISILRAVLTILILESGLGLSGIAYPSLIATIISLLAFSIISKKVVPEFVLMKQFIRSKTLKMLLLYGGYSTIISISDLIRLQIDSLVIGKFIGTDQVGIYAIAALIVQYFLKIIVSGMGVLKPRFAALEGSNELSELQETFLKSLSVSSFISCGAGMLLLIFGDFFINFWVGPEFEGAIPVLYILTIAYIFALAQTPGIALMFALNKHRYYAFVTTIEALVNVCLSIYLASTLGIIGVALGTAIPMMIVKIFIQPFYTSRIAAISAFQYTKAIMPNIIVALLLIITFKSFNIFSLFSFTTKNIYTVAIMSAILSLAYLFIISSISIRIKIILLSLLHK
ncbi:oligosaccharide flippase family protein [Desulfopila aestuarii]|uniref:Membrane protein involved in the export of O-antigen and teichoic acid n=1 Tax=Desulfopila aestuarii DSM 18488 TaxID=1121416 RepID=A0A1M7YFR2_9BACT|nr:oligosaccharide flippase family protein [Desulfopila aestuarii]SHO51460.1 Membrane protein involved in the export of O-antigen and teichoic acid [Desulfopila aestuarii DSM 18488]